MIIFKVEFNTLQDLIIFQLVRKSLSKFKGSNELLFNLILVFNPKN